MKRSGMRLGVIALSVAFAAASVPGRPVRASGGRPVVYLYENCGFLITAALDAAGRFTDTSAVDGVPAQKNDFTLRTYDTQSVAFSRRLHQVVIASGQSVTTVAVDPATGLPAPDAVPVSTPAPDSLLLRSVDVVEAAETSYVYAADYGDNTDFSKTHGSKIYGFAMAEEGDGRLTPLPGSPYEFPDRFLAGETLIGSHALGVAHLNDILVAGVLMVDLANKIGGLQSNIRMLQPFRIQADGSLKVIPGAVQAGVGRPSLRAVAVPAPMIFAADCSGIATGGFAAFHVNPATGFLAGTPYATADGSPCSLALQPGSVVLGGGDPNTALEVFRMTSRGAFQLIETDVSPAEYAGVIAFANNQTLITAGDLDRRGEKLLLRSWHFSPRGQRLTPARVRQPGPADIIGFQRPAVPLGTVDGEALLQGGLITYASPGSWTVRGMATFQP